MDMLMKQNETKDVAVVLWCGEHHALQARQETIKQNEALALVCPRSTCL